MPDTPSITLVKRFMYRDAPEEWSNTYHFTGTTPSDEAAWKTLALAIHATEKGCYKPTSVLVRAYGYEAGTEHSVAQIDFSVGTPLLPPGGFTGGTGSPEWAGDQAGWIRAKIGVSSKGKSVYVRKYFHDGKSLPTDSDEINTVLTTAYLDHANAMLSGSLPGGAKWSGPQGQTATLPKVARYVTTRTLKRRGRRP